MFVGFGYGADRAAGITYSHYIVGDVFHHDRATANDYVRTNLHAWHYMYACANPYIIAHRDGVGVLQALIAALGINRMTCSVETTVGSDKHIIAKSDFGTIQNDGIVVGKEVLAYFDIIAIIAPEWCQNAAVVGFLAKQLVEDLLLVGFVRRA